jgi:hypothetical protein
MKSKLNGLGPVLICASLSGCTAYYPELSAVPYDANKAVVDNPGLLSQRDLLPFNNPQPKTITAGLPLAYFHLRNTGDRALRIRVRAMPGDWTEFVIPSGEPMDFRCDGCSNSYVQIAIPTDGRDILVRTLSLQMRYDIFWDYSEKRWDVRPVI